MRDDRMAAQPRLETTPCASATNVAAHPDLLDRLRHERFELVSDRPATARAYAQGWNDRGTSIERCLRELAAAPVTTASHEQDRSLKQALIALDIHEAMQP